MKKMPILVTVAGAAVVAVAACITMAEARAERKQPEQAADVLSAKGMEVLRKPAKVEFFRIKPEPSDAAAEAIERYPVVATGTTPDDAAERIRSILTDDDSYLFGVGKGCIIRPGVAIRLTGGDETTVSVILCYECQILVLVVRDAAGKELHNSGGVFDPSEAALVRLAKDAFPEDEDIQKLKDVGN